MEILKIKNKLTGRTKEEKLQKIDGDEFRKHVMRYGYMLTDSSRTDKMGARRDTQLFINGMIASIEMLNGEVKAWGLSVGDNDIRIINSMVSDCNIKLIKD